VTLHGRVVVIEKDADCGPIDRLSRHYTGRPYSQRDRGRFTAVIEVESWHSWAVGEPWSGSS
jgi:hypothetical protein